MKKLLIGILIGWLTVGATMATKRIFEFPSKELWLEDRVNEIVHLLRLIEINTHNH